MPFSHVINKTLESLKSKFKTHNKEDDRNLAICEKTNWFTGMWISDCCYYLEGFVFQEKKLS